MKASVDGYHCGYKSQHVVRTAHKDWYGELFQPCVSAGFIPVGAHSRATAMMQCICAHRATYLRDGRRSETRCRHCSICSKRKPIRAFAPFSGNGLFGYIHPYRDGNGRMARFLMNAMLASGGYPWTVIRVEDRDAYLGALDPLVSTQIFSRSQPLSQSACNGRWTRRPVRCAWLQPHMRVEERFRNWPVEQHRSSRGIRFTCSAVCGKPAESALLERPLPLPAGHRSDRLRGS